MTSHELLDLVVRQIVQSSILIIAVAAVTRIFCRRRAHLAYLLWVLVLIKLVTPPIWSSPTGIFSWASSQTARTGVAVSAHPNSTVSAQQDIITTAFRAPAVAPIPPKPTATWSPTDVAAVVWAAGCLGMLLTIAIRSLYLGRRIASTSMPVPVEVLDMIESLRRFLGIRRPVALKVTNEPLGPAVFGSFRPTLVVPTVILENQSSVQLRALFAHELIHLRRGDTLIAGLQLLVQSVWWFHPLVWWANRRINQAREMCCDAEVIADIQCPRDDYAQMLVDVLRRRRTLRPVAMSLGVRPAQVTAQRFDHVLSGAGWSHRHLPLRYWLVLAFGGLLILPGSGMRFHHDGGTVLAQDAVTNSATPNDNAQGTKPTPSVLVVVGIDSVTLDGRPYPLDELVVWLERWPDRSDTVLKLGYASDDVTVGRFNSVTGRICNDKEARKLGFKATSFVGLQKGSGGIVVDVDVDTIRVDGKLTTLEELPKELEAIPNHADKVLVIHYLSDQITMGRISEVEGKIMNDSERTKLGFKHISFGGLGGLDLSGSVKPTDQDAVPILLTPSRPPLPQAPESQLTHHVDFQTGLTDFIGGDSITITEVRGTADTVNPGNTYEVRGTYHLASHDEADLALSVTASAVYGSGSPWPDNQHMTVHRGDGEFVVYERIAVPGSVHVSFYADGHSIGGVYFGTGDSVLKKW